MPGGRVDHDEANLDTVDPATRRDHLQKKGPLEWHVKKAPQGPRSLALKNHFIAMVGEYVGTVLFMIFALGGTNVANIPTTSVTGSTTAGQDGSTASTANTSNLLYISLSFGFSLAVNAWIFFRVSGGLFNPAVSLGMVLVGALTPLRGALLSVSQILGGITGAAIIQAITPGTLNVRTELGGGTSIPQGLFIEMFLTSLLMLAILLLAAEKHKATFIAPIGIGLALFVAELLGVYYTGGSLNPARSFGPAVVLRTFSGYHWIYWVGPGLGAIIAAGFYKMLKWLQYETVLGPEADSESQPAPSSSRTQGDEEKAISTGRTAAISGPGLGDLHTVGNRDAVFDLEHKPGPLENRLERIEAMLNQMMESRQGGVSSGMTGSGGYGARQSDSTFIEGRGDGHGNYNKYAGAVGHHDVDVAAPTTGTGIGNGNGNLPVSHSHVYGQDHSLHNGAGHLSSAQRAEGNLAGLPQAELGRPRQ